MFSFRSVVVTSLLISIVPCSNVSFAEVEAVKGKRYTLHRNHGPWMIMVASLRDVPEERRRRGLTASQAADQLIYELRRLGVPAYAFRQSQEIGTLSDFSSSAADTEKKYVARHEAVAVLAGNYKSADDKDAQEILKYLKTKFEPAFLKDERFGGIIQKTPGRPKPLSRAHMTVNPLMPADEIKRRTTDPLIKRLNSDMQYSVLRNKKKYTLKIATFEGSSIVQVNGSRASAKAEKFFDKMMGDSLDASGKKAWELTESLRSAKKLGYDRNYEAWVYHDRYKSIVTIGSFDSPTDPRITTLARQFGGKSRTHEGKDVQTAEVFTIPRNLVNGRKPDKLWMFDLRPTLIKVPR